MHRSFKTLLLFALIALIETTGQSAQASNSGITYHGRIVKPDGAPLVGNSVQFKLQILSPGNESCLLYEEVQTLDMANSSGIFSISINDGTGTRADASGIAFNSVFSNRSPFVVPAGTCAVGTVYAPNSADGRSFVVSFKDETMQGYESLPSQPVNFAPTAIQALSIAGFVPNNLFRVDDATSVANTSPLNTAQYDALMAVANGTAPYVSATTTGGAALPVVTAPPTSPASGSIWFNSASGSLQFYNGTLTQSIGTSTASGTVTSIATGPGLSGGPITTSGTLSLAAFGTAGSYYKVVTDSTGRVSSGNSALVETDIPNLVTAGHVSGSAITSGIIAGSTAVNSTGAITTTGTITGANVTATTLSGQSLRVFNSANTFKIIMTAPALTADYNLVFPLTAGSLGYVLSTDGNGNLSWILPGGAPSGAAGGDLSGTYPNPSLAKLSGTPLGISSLASGNYLRYNGTSWANSTIQASDLPSLATGQTGILPIANGGTGTSNGSITGAGALVFSAGGTNQNIVLTPSGSGSTLLNGNIGVGTTSPAATLQVSGNSMIIGASAISIGALYYNGSATQPGCTTPSPANDYCNDAFVGIYNPTTSLYYGITAQLPAPSGVSAVGGYYAGMGIGGSTNNAGNPIFGVLTSTQSSNGVGHTAFTVYDTNKVSTFHNVLDDDAGNVGVGTTSPLTNLDVVGTFRSGSTGPGVATTFSSAATATATSFSVASTAGYPSSGFLYLTNGSQDEVVSYTGITTTTFTGVTRGLYSTPASAWTSGASLDLVLQIVGQSTGLAPQFIATQTKGLGFGITPAGWVTSGGVQYAGSLYSGSGIVALNSNQGLSFGSSTAWVHGYGSASSSDNITFATNSAQRMVLDGSGNFGVGTTSPNATFTVNGHVSNVGISAMVGSCGTSPSITGNDTRGLVTLGSGNPTACTITFAAAYATAPYCVITPYGGLPGAIQWYITTTTASLTMSFSATPTTGQQFQYHCMQ